MQGGLELCWLGLDCCDYFVGQNGQKFTWVQSGVKLCVHDREILKTANQFLKSKPIILLKSIVLKVSPFCFWLNTRYFFWSLYFCIVRNFHPHPKRHFANGFKLIPGNIHYLHFYLYELKHCRYQKINFLPILCISNSPLTLPRRK